MQRKTELLLAGLVAMGGIVFGLSEPVQSSNPSWSAQASILDSFSSQPLPYVSEQTAQTATDILSVRDAFGSRLSAQRMRFEIVDLPGESQVFLDAGTSAENAFQRTAASQDFRSAETTSLRVGAEVISPQADTSLTPYAGLALTPDGTQGRVGAQLVIGDGRGPDSRWFFFAAAERQAVFYDPRHMRQPLQAIDITPYSVIGDGQAGIAYRLNDNADIALAYVRQEWAYHYGNDGWREDEEFTAISFMARW